MSSGADGQQPDRLTMLVRENARRRHRPKLQEDLAAVIGREPSLDEFLSLAAADRLHAAVVEQGRYHLVTHRVWGDRLGAEAAMTLRTIAQRLDGEEAYLLLWKPTTEAVLVPVRPVLEHAALNLSRASDVTLVSPDAEAGLTLTWDHLVDADEYSLRTWGRFAFDLSE
jgi:hypothetical protein